MAGKIQQALQSAIETRDAFLQAACNHMNEVIQTYAEKSGFLVQDDYDGIVLIERRLIDPKRFKVDGLDLGRW
jgi:hypothetical protein